MTASATWTTPNTVLVNSNVILATLSFGGPPISTICDFCTCSAQAYAFSSNASSTSGTVSRTTLTSAPGLTNSTQERFSYLAPGQGTYTVELLVGFVVVRTLAVRVVYENITITGVAFPQPPATSAAAQSLEIDGQRVVEVQIRFSRGVSNFGPATVRAEAAILSSIAGNQDATFFQLTFFGTLRLSRGRRVMWSNWYGRAQIEVRPDCDSVGPDYERYTVHWLPTVTRDR